MNKENKEYKAAVDQRTLEIKNLSEELEAKRHDHETLLKHIVSWMISTANYRLYSTK